MINNDDYNFYECYSCRKVCHSRNKWKPYCSECGKKEGKKVKEK